MKSNLSTKSETGRTILSPNQSFEKIDVAAQSIHHVAYFCYDAEETRHFYEDLLGWPLVHAFRVDESDLPTPNFSKPYMHIFFEVEDRSCIAFFDIQDEPTLGMTIPHPEINHIAFKVQDSETLSKAKQRLEDAGVRVVGKMDHGFVQSIYFEDPNGVNLELTYESADQAYMQHAREIAHDNLIKWAEEKNTNKVVKNVEV